MKNTKNTDKCKACGSGDLFDTDSDPDYQGQYLTFCNQCGQVQQKPVKKVRRDAVQDVREGESK